MNPPPKRYVLESPRQLQAVVSPLRHHLLRTLGRIGPSSVRELAERLGRSPESLYYHLGALEKVRLVVRSERPSGQRTEAVFSTVAENLYTDPRKTSAAYLDAYAKSISALLRLTDRQLQGAVEEQKAQGAARPRSLRAQQVQVRLSPRAIRELSNRLDSILEFLFEHDDPGQKAHVAVTLASAPLHDGRSTAD